QARRPVFEVESNVVPSPPEDDRPAVPAAALKFHVERRAALELRLRVRFLDTDLEAGASLDHRHLWHRAAAHPESDGKALRLKDRKFDMRLAVEGRGLSRPARAKRNRALNRPSIVMVAGQVRQVGIERVMRQKAV